MRARQLVSALAALIAVAGYAVAAQADPSPSTADGQPHAGAAAKRIRLARIGTFDAPTYVTAPPRDRNRVFVTERAGVIRVISHGRRRKRPFLDIRSLTDPGDGETGLLSMAFAPDYARSRRFYVYFTDGGNGDVRIEEFKRSRKTPNRAVRSSRRRVIVIRHRESGNHKGGQLQFGPGKLLYAGIGDGGGGGDPRGNGQNLRTLLGKLIRIDPRPKAGRRYRIPRSNPFRKPGGARGEIFAYGLRNPYRFSFDRKTGDLAIADVGQNEVEEVDFLRRGRRGAPRAGVNFGWSIFEGRRRFKDGTARGHVPPVLQQAHSDGFVAIIGGYVVRDPKLVGLRGRYLYGDLGVPRLRRAKLQRPRAIGDRATRLSVNSLVSFGEDARSRVYAVSLDGPVYRLVRR